MSVILASGQRHCRTRMSSRRVGPPKPERLAFESLASERPAFALETRPARFNEMRLSPRTVLRACSLLDMPQGASAFPKDSLPETFRLVLIMLVAGLVLESGQERLAI